MMNTPLRIVIADDTPDLRMLLRLALERQGDFEVVGEAADGIEVVAEVEAKKPDAVLLDLAMPRRDGLQAIPDILMASPMTKIVVLSAFDASSMAERTIGRGAHAYVSKGTPPANIAAALRDACGASAPERVGPSTGSDDLL